MTEADRLFGRFPDFIKEYIYRHEWTRFREVQLAAARVLFESDDNLLLSSSTASGKTEAVFFPILSELCAAKEPPVGVSVLYIAPLKSLINDQFGRMEELLDASGIPVFHWHGDVGASHKTKLLKDPKGILQITPESLESMLMNRSNDIPRIFAGLKYVVLDEIHTAILTPPPNGSERGAVGTRKRRPRRRQNCIGGSEWSISTTRTRTRNSARRLTTRRTRNAPASP